MIPYERQQKILDLLEDQELMKIEDLLSSFPSVSESTLRRDLKELEKKQKIELLTGGAFKKASPAGQDIPIARRHTLNIEMKEKIAQRAAELVENGDTIYLDSGSTCFELFQKICQKDITVYTSNTDILSMHDNFKAEVIVLPGRFNPNNSSLSGSMTESMLKNLYFGKSFLGMNGIDERFGLTTPTMEEANKKKLVRDHSSQCYVLCDSSKFHKLTSVKVFDLKDITIVSDKSDETIGNRVPILTE